MFHGWAQSPWRQHWTCPGGKHPQTKHQNLLATRCNPHDSRPLFANITLVGMMWVLNLKGGPRRWTKGWARSGKKFIYIFLGHKDILILSVTLSAWNSRNNMIQTRASLTKQPEPNNLHQCKRVWPWLKYNKYIWTKDPTWLLQGQIYFDKPRENTCPVVPRSGQVTYWSCSQTRSLVKPELTQPGLQEVIFEQNKKYNVPLDMCLGSIAIAPKTHVRAMWVGNRYHLLPRYCFSPSFNNLNELQRIIIEIHSMFNGFICPVAIAKNHWMPNGQGYCWRLDPYEEPWQR